MSSYVCVCVCRATCVQWGDHAFYPFFYSIQAHYLIEPFELHPVAYLAIVAVFFTGYTIFRQCASLSLFSFFLFMFLFSFLSAPHTTHARGTQGEQPEGRVQARRKEGQDLGQARDDDQGRPPPDLRLVGYAPLSHYAEPPPRHRFSFFIFPPPNTQRMKRKTYVSTILDIGVGRHINYLGDILIAVGWTLPCGFSSLIVRHRPVVLCFHRSIALN